MSGDVREVSVGPDEFFPKTTVMISMTVRNGVQSFSDSFRISPEEARIVHAKLGEYLATLKETP